MRRWIRVKKGLLSAVVLVLLAGCGSSEEETIPENTGMETEQSQSTAEEAQMETEPDILLTEAPPLVLTDPLSSRYEKIEIPSGSYTWNYEEDGEMIGIAACGAAPLEPAEDRGRIDIPDYQNMDAVPYLFSFTRNPDRMIVAEYDAEEGVNPEAEPIAETFYEEDFLVELRSDRIYAVTAEWQEAKTEERGFYGKAEYFIYT